MRRFVSQSCLPAYNNGVVVLFVLPDASYYENPAKKGSVSYRLDFEAGKIAIQASHLEKGRRVGSYNEYPLSEIEAKRFLSAMGEADEYRRSIENYAVEDGLGNCHTLLAFDGASCYIPDYLANFGELDIFDRYRYFPKQEKVAFYQRTRALLKLLFERFGYPPEKPIFLKTHYALRNNENAYRLSDEPLSK